MNKKRIFILNGHPAEVSLSKKLAETYADAAIAAGHEVRITHLNDRSLWSTEAQLAQFALRVRKHRNQHPNLI